MSPCSDMPATIDLTSSRAPSVRPAPIRQPSNQSQSGKASSPKEPEVKLESAAVEASAPSA